MIKWHMLVIHMVMDMLVKRIVDILEGERIQTRCEAIEIGDK